MSEYALEIQDLTKKFDGFILDHISFRLPTGFIMGLVGKNGAGKTTTIKLLLELLQKDNGSIKILGIEADENFDIKQDIAVVFDDLFLVDDWKIADVEAAISPFYKSWESSAFHQYLGRFHLPLKKKVKDLSRGMKMKLMLAVALSHKARLLILDEPTSGLDPVARDELLDILMQYIENEQNSILFSTHITSDLDKIADYLTIMDVGKIFFTGSKDELFENYCLVKGNSDSLMPEIEEKLIGLQKSKVNFSALMNVKDMAILTSDMICESATIDDILIHISAD